MLFEKPINRYPPFIPSKNETNNIRAELGTIQKYLIRWSKASDYWGPRVWYYLHNTAAHYLKKGTYTPTQVDALCEWLLQIPRILPCRQCRYWYRKYVVNKLDIRAVCSDSQLFFNTIVDIHNRVNTKLGKPIVSRDVVYMYFVQQ